MESVQCRWCLGYVDGKYAAGSLGEWSSVEGRVGDNSGEKMMVV
jgi:hypothetical protein